MKPKLEIDLVSSGCSYSEECKEPVIFYRGKWRKLGDYVRYEHARGVLRRLWRYRIVYINEGGAQLQLPNWFYRDAKCRSPHERRAPIIGNTINPLKDKPKNWMV